MNKTPYDWIKKMPVKYTELALPYLNRIELAHKRSKTVDSLPEALKIAIPWHPGGTSEGYEFWSEIYYFYCGLRPDLPELIDPYKIKYDTQTQSYSFQCALSKATEAKEILEQLFERMSGGRETIQVSMRLIMFTHIYTANIASLSLKSIGKVVGRMCNRKRPFDHSTVLHCLNEHNKYLDSGDRYYCNMWKLFNQKLAERVSVTEIIEN
jgi:hypothetical protein